MIFASPLPAVPLPEEALTPYTLARAAELGGKAALVDAVTGSALTYAELDEAIRTQAGGWIERGLAKGDVVAIMAPNCPEYATVFHSVALAGGAVTTINPTYTVRELVHQLDDAGATRLVTVPGLEETVAAAIPESPVRETFVIGTSAGAIPRLVHGEGSSRSRSRCRSISTTSWRCRTRRARRASQRASCSRTATSTANMASRC